MVRLALLAIVAIVSVSTSASATTVMEIRDLCRIKGQEINTLQGIGLVVGLQGTGDGDATTTQRSLARTMQQLGASMPMGATGQLDLTDVSDFKNVALVIITANIPGVGAQQGDMVDVKVSALSAKSLAGGRLLPTPLLGPRPGSNIVYAMAQGEVRLRPDGTATTGSIQGGAKMESNVKASYVEDGYVTLILDQDFASFDLADHIANEINGHVMSTSSGGSSYDSARLISSSPEKAMAIDQKHIRFPIPGAYLQNPISHITKILDLKVPVSGNSRRVVINELDGIVVIGRDVEIAPGLISHKGMRIEAVDAKSFQEINDKADETTNVKLKGLTDALSALNVPTEDLIAIIKTLKAKGDLYGDVVFH